LARSGFAGALDSAAPTENANEAVNNRAIGDFMRSTSKSVGGEQTGEFYNDP
jgi:hypothetical protein